ncbi:hypothetical protein SPI_09378 [Niveomyces insectorum RCEF 264]|uniref:Uncharacterized protein n=1 Tax=Niveomyces insectorum RCEF 264 TaxID=1081102 RepID=A0A162MAQ5_9HYPO|nr:hypothetical protein SPI_09378 [Niveomyces insectorum RCEF 264]
MAPTSYNRPVAQGRSQQHNGNRNYQASGSIIEYQYVMDSEPLNQTRERVAVHGYRIDNLSASHQAALREQERMRREAAALRHRQEMERQREAEFRRQQAMQMQQQRRMQAELRNRQAFVAQQVNAERFRERQLERREGMMENRERWFEQNVMANMNRRRN